MEKRGEKKLEKASLAFKKPALRPAEVKKPADAKSASSSGGSKWTLGSTQGMFAAGAWAARNEVAHLLEARCDPSELIRLVRAGEEGHQPLSVGAGATSPLHVEPAEIGELVGSPDSPRTSTENLLDGDDLSKQVESHKALLEKLAASKADPPWTQVKMPGRSRQSPFGSGDGPRDLIFRKRASPPSAELLAAREAAARREQVKSLETPVIPEEDRVFKKRALPPTKEDLEAEKERRQKASRLTGMGARPGSMKEREAKELKRFHTFALRIFDSLKCLEVPMDLEELVVKDSVLDEDRFFTHTCPNRAATGLRYARCIQGLLKWVSDIPSEERKSRGARTNLARLHVVDYLEYIIQVGVGFNTPYTVLYSLDFFGKAFGFCLESNLWDRCKRLANRYSNLKPSDVNRAPPFRKDFLATLERIVLDTTRSDAERVVCGKLRLCVQASVRYDDILHTPLASCQWIRKRGETAVVGLRSISSQGKHHARYWVASLMGVCPDHDEWLLVLMDLILSSHGTNWRKDDHTGKMSDFEMDGFTPYPARLENDVSTLRATLNRWKTKGEYIGLSHDEITDIRWHSAKSTFSSLMQHLNVETKVVRLAGGWSSKDEAMPDTYLREAQVMVLGAQEKVLEHLRQGGDLEKFEVAPLDDPPARGGENKTHEDVEKKSSEAMEPFSGKHHSRCREELLDGAFDPTGRPDFDKVQLETAVKIEVDRLEELMTKGAEPLEMVPELPTKDESSEEDSDVEATSPTEIDDAEGMVSSFVMVDKPSVRSKLHLGKESLSDVHGYVMLAAPKCGAAGSYAVIQAGEKIAEDTELCARCFGRDNFCKKLCEFTMGGEGQPVLRCGRACGSTTECSGPHKCPLHAGATE